MVEISTDEILDYRNKPDSYLMVFVNLKGCQGCEMFKPIVESMETVFPEIEFRSLTVKCMDEMPVFASASLPSTALFYEGMRIREFPGGTNSREQFRDIIKSWVL